jgi:YVTN family beta-propeller protein
VVPPPPPPGVGHVAPPLPNEPSQRPPGGISGFPTTNQLIAVAVAAVVVVGAGGAYLFLGRGATTAGSPAPVPATAVAVVHDGPAVLTTESLTGGAAGKSIAVTGTPTRMVTTADGTKAFLLDSSHGQVIPVDLAVGAQGAPIPAGKLPTDERLSADGSTLYVVDNLAGAVIPVNTATGIARPARQLVSGMDAFAPSPTNDGAVISTYSSAGHPGTIYFLGATSLSGPVLVGQNTASAVAYSPDGATVWIAQDGVGSLPGVVIPVDARTHAVGRPITVGHGVSNATRTPDGRLLVVTNSLDRNVSLVDLTTRTVVATVPVGAGPISVTVSADSATAWVTCVLARALVPVDLRAHTAGTPVSLANAPADVSLVNGGGSAWVLFPSSPGSVRLLTSPTGGFGQSIPVGNGPSLLIAHDAASAWTANVLADTVQKVDLAGHSASRAVNVSRTPEQLVLSPDHRALFVLSLGDGAGPGYLTSIDTTSLAAGTPLAVGVAPSSLVITPDGSMGFIANRQTNSVATVNLHTWKAGAPIALPCSPTQLVITPDGSKVYADCSESSAVVPISVTSGVAAAPIAVGDGSSLVMGNQGKLIFVRADHGLQEIEVAVDRVVLSHDVTANIISISPTPDDATLVGVDNTGADLLLINAATLATSNTVSVGARPGGAQLSPDGARAYVLDTGQQKLYIVDVAAAAVTATVDVSPGASSVAVPSLRP